MTSRALNIIVYLFCLFFIGVGFVIAELRAQSVPTLTYHVYIQPGERGRVEATMQGINVSSVTFQMLNNAFGLDVLGNISDVTAEDFVGNKLLVTSVSDGWMVNTSGKNDFTFKYNFGTSLSDSGAYGTYHCIVTNSGAFFENNVVFAFPDKETTQIEVIFHKPESWTVGTSLLPLDGERYQVPSVPTLKDGLLDESTRMGVAEAVVSQVCDNLEITFIAYQATLDWDWFWSPAYGNTMQEQMQEYIDLNCDSIRYLGSMFGFWPGGSRYWISNSVTGLPESHLHFNRWMQSWPRERYPQVPHHSLHAWMWWASSSSIQLSASEWLWMAEGIPTYFESELTQVLIGDSMWRGILYPNYLIFKRAAQFGLLGKSSVNKYAYGSMRALAMDRKISETTGGQKSLYDLLHVLGQSYGLERKRFSRSELINAINEVTGTNLSDFYQRYFSEEVSSELPPVDTYMADYVEDFWRWLDYQLNSQTFMNWAKGYRTMFFIDLELALHSPVGLYDETYTATASGLYHLDDFRRAMAGVNPVTEEKVINVLSSLTGKNQVDFFDFYTISGWRPSVAEIQAWLDPTNYIPDITIPPGSVSFGSVNVGNTSDQTITIQNDGSAILTVGAITSPSAPFRKVADNCSNKTLSPNQTCTLTYRFAPTSAGTFNSNSNIPSNDPDESNVTVTLTGTGRLQDVNDTTEFVKQQYHDFLNREADAGGLQYWVNMIDSGAMTRAQVIESFFWSEEFGTRIAPIVRLYFAYFLRIPDYEGLMYWINGYNSGWLLEAISDSFAGSEEFRQRYGALSNETFVNLVYQNILGRSPDSGGYAFWAGELNSGRRTRGQVMIGFSESAEYKGLTGHEVYVTMMYVGMLRRSPEDEGFNFWVDYLDRGNSGLALIDGFLYLQEYADRFQ